MMNGKRLMIYVALSLFFCMMGSGDGSFHIETAVAQEGDNFDWEGEGTTEENWSGKNGGTQNIFLNTDKISFKVGAFSILSAASFVFFWQLFSRLIKKERSPARSFTVSFSMFMLSLLFIAFVCFSEYALDRAYDAQLFYLSQLNLPILAIAFVAWIPFSFGITLFLRGRS